MKSLSLAAVEKNATAAVREVVSCNTVRMVEECLPEAATQEGSGTSL